MSRGTEQVSHSAHRSSRQQSVGPGITADMVETVLRWIAVGLWLLVAIAALLLITPAFPPVTRHPELAGALIAAAGTIFAGWLAWASVERQIRATDEARRHERASAVMSAATDVIAASYALTTPDPNIEPLIIGARVRIGEVDFVNPTLGSALRAGLDDAARANRMAQDMRSARQKSFVTADTLKPKFESLIGKTSFRLRLLAEAMGRAADAYRNGDEIRLERCIERSLVETTATECGVTLEELGYLKAWVAD